ncbi:MAG: ATP12 family protein [Rickettsiales bacterium]
MFSPCINKEKSPLTPEKKPFCVPTQALADAISEEWEKGKKFSPSNMPLTSLVYTAIDRVEEQKDNIIEVLIAYVDTDTLTYRSTNSEKLADRQKKEWEPITKWASKEFEAIWHTTSGSMPIEQPKELHDAISNYLKTLTALELSAACVLSSTFSSLVLAVAVLKKHLSAEAAYELSRLEEEVQAEQWGRDVEAEQRNSRVKAEIGEISRFLRLLDAA